MLEYFKKDKIQKKLAVEFRIGSGNRFSPELDTPRSGNPLS